MKKTLKRMYMALVVVLFMMFGAIAYTGCQSYLNDQGQQVTTLTPAATDALDKAADMSPVVIDALVGVGVAFPASMGILGVIAGVIGGLTKAYKKYRPQLTAEQNKAKMYSDVTKAIVYAIEEFKANNGENWEALKYELRLQLMDKVGPEALAIIEAIVEAYRRRDAVEPIKKV